MCFYVDIEHVFYFCSSGEFLAWLHKIKKNTQNDVLAINTWQELVVICAIMDVMIEAVTEHGPGAMVKGVISNTLKLAIPSLLSSKVGVETMF